MHIFQSNKGQGLKVSHLQNGGANIILKAIQFFQMESPLHAWGTQGVSNCHHDVL